MPARARITDIQKGRKSTENNNIKKAKIRSNIILSYTVCPKIQTKNLTNTITNTIDATAAIMISSKFPADSTSRNKQSPVSPARNWFQIPLRIFPRRVNDSVYHTYNFDARVLTDFSILIFHNGDNLDTIAARANSFSCKI